MQAASMQVAAPDAAVAPEAVQPAAVALPAASWRRWSAPPLPERTEAEAQAEVKEDAIAMTAIAMTAAQVDEDEVGDLSQSEDEAEGVDGYEGAGLQTASALAATSQQPGQVNSERDQNTLVHLNPQVSAARVVPPEAGPSQREPQPILHTSDTGTAASEGHSPLSLSLHADVAQEHAKPVQSPSQPSAARAVSIPLRAPPPYMPTPSPIVVTPPVHTGSAIAPGTAAAAVSPMAVAPSSSSSAAPRPAAPRRRFGDAETVILESIPTNRPGPTAMPMVVAPPVEVLSAEDVARAEAALVKRSAKVPWTQAMFDALAAGIKAHTRHRQDAAGGSEHIGTDWEAVAAAVSAVGATVTASKCQAAHKREQHKQRVADKAAEKAAAAAAAAAEAAKPKPAPPADVFPAAPMPLPLPFLVEEGDMDDEKDTSHSRAVAAAAAQATREAFEAAFKRRRMALVVDGGSVRSDESHELTTQLSDLSFTCTHDSFPFTRTSIDEFASRLLEGDFVWLRLSGRAVQERGDTFLLPYHTPSSDDTSSDSQPHPSLTVTEGSLSLQQVYNSIQRAASDLLVIIVLDCCVTAPWKPSAPAEHQWVVATGRAGASSSAPAALTGTHACGAGLRIALQHPDLPLSRLFDRAHQAVSVSECQGWSVEWSPSVREDVVLFPTPPPPPQADEPIPTAAAAARKRPFLPVDPSLCCPCKSRCDVEKCPCVQGQELCRDCKPGIGYCSNRDPSRVAPIGSSRRRTKPSTDPIPAATMVDTKADAAPHAPAAVVAAASPKLPKPKPNLATLLRERAMAQAASQPPKSAPVTFASNDLLEVTPEWMRVSKRVLQWVKPADGSATPEGAGAAVPRAMAVSHDTKAASVSQDRAPAETPSEPTASTVASGGTTEPVAAAATVDASTAASPTIPAPAKTHVISKLKSNPKSSQHTGAQVANDASHAAAAAGATSATPQTASRHADAASEHKGSDQAGSKSRPLDVESDAPLARPLKRLRRMAEVEEVAAKRDHAPVKPAIPTVVPAAFAALASAKPIEPDVVASGSTSHGSAGTGTSTSSAKPTAISYEGTSLARRSGDLKPQGGSVSPTKVTPKAVPVPVHANGHGAALGAKKPLPGSNSPTPVPKAGVTHKRTGLPASPVRTPIPAPNSPRVATVTPAAAAPSKPVPVPAPVPLAAASSVATPAKPAVASAPVKPTAPTKPAAPVTATPAPAAVAPVKPPPPPSPSHSSTPAPFVKPGGRPALPPLPPRGHPDHFRIKKQTLCPFLTTHWGCAHGDSCGYSHDPVLRARSEQAAAANAAAAIAAKEAAAAGKSVPIAVASSSLSTPLPTSSLPDSVRLSGLLPDTMFLLPPPRHAVLFQHPPSASGAAPAQGQGASGFQAIKQVTVGMAEGESEAPEGQGEKSRDRAWVQAAARLRRFRFLLQGSMPGEGPKGPLAHAGSSADAVADAQHVADLLVERGIITRGVHEIWWTKRSGGGGGSASSGAGGSRGGNPASTPCMEIQLRPSASYDPLLLLSEGQQLLKFVATLKLVSALTVDDRLLLEEDQRALLASSTADKTTGTGTGMDGTAASLSTSATKPTHSIRMIHSSAPTAPAASAPAAVDASAWERDRIERDRERVRARDLQRERMRDRSPSPRQRSASFSREHDRGDRDRHWERERERDGHPSREQERERDRGANDATDRKRERPRGSRPSKWDVGEQQDDKRFKATAPALPPHASQVAPLTQPGPPQVSAFAPSYAAAPPAMPAPNSLVVPPPQPPLPPAPVAPVTAAVSPPVGAVTVADGRCVHVYDAPPTHDLSAEPLRSILARRRIVVEGLPVHVSEEMIRVSNHERLRDGADVLRMCVESGMISPAAAELSFILRHSDRSRRVELQLVSEDARNACLGRASMLEQRWHGVRVLPGEAAIANVVQGGAAMPSFQTHATPAQYGVPPQPHFQQVPPPTHYQAPPAPAATFPAPPVPAAAPAPAAPSSVPLSSSATAFPFSPLSGIPANSSAQGLYDYYGLPPADGAALFDFANAPYAVYHSVPENALIQPRAEEVARRGEELRRRQLLLLYTPLPPGWPFPSDPSGDAARLADARQVYSALERAHMLSSALGDAVRMLYRLEDGSARVVIQLAGADMVDALARRDPRGLHELGWAMQRADGSWLVPPRAAITQAPQQPSMQQPPPQPHHPLPQQQQPPVQAPPSYGDPLPSAPSFSAHAPPPPVQQHHHQQPLHSHAQWAPAPSAPPVPHPTPPSALLSHFQQGHNTPHAAQQQQMPFGAQPGAQPLTQPSDLRLLYRAAADVLHPPGAHAQHQPRFFPPTR